MSEIELVETSYNSGLHFRNQFEVRMESTFRQQLPCTENSVQLQKSRFPPSHPSFSSVSSICVTPHSPFSQFSFSDALFEQNERQIHSQRASFLPLSRGYLTGSCTDVNEANPSPLIPSPNSLPPYISSEISDISPPLVVSGLKSAFHSTSDLSLLIQTSPNSHEALINSSNPIHPNPVGSIGHFVDQSSPTPTKQPNETHTCLWDGCRQTFDELDDLIQHIGNAHIATGKVADFTCMWQSCPRKRKPFSARYKLVAHIRTHSGEKPFKCTYPGCTRDFTQLENCNIHFRTHTGEKPYLCQYRGCQKKFGNASDRSKHLRTHFDPKPYACTHLGCIKRYTDPSSLRKHAKRHLPGKKKPYACTHLGCTKHYKDPNSLRKHAEAHLPRKKIQVGPPEPAPEPAPQQVVQYIANVLVPTSTTGHNIPEINSDMYTMFC